MKKIILFILFNVSILNLYAKDPTSVQENDIILIRHYYMFSTMSKSNIKVYKNNNEVESIETPAITENDKNNSFMILRDLLQKYTLEGYSIVTSNVTSGSTTVYILQKK